MSNDEPTWGPRPEEDPFRKRRPPRQEPPGESEQPGEPGPPGGSGPPPGQGPYGSPPPPPGPGSGEGDPYGGGQGDPYGGGRGGGGQWPGGGGPGGPGGPYGQGPYGGPYGQGPYGGDPYGRDPYGGAPGTGPLAGMPPLAPFGRRLAARIIDMLIVGVPLTVIVLAAYGFDLSTSDGRSETDQFGADFNTGQQWLWTLISIVAYIAYDTWMTSAYGRTLGKRWLGLRVGMLADGAVPGAGPSLLRAVVLWVPALLCCYVLWWALIAVTILASRTYRQGWHDKAARTVVVTT